MIATIATIVLMAASMQAAASASRQQFVACLKQSVAEVVRKATEMMAFSYLGKDPSRSLLADPRVSPLHAAAKLPPSFLVVGTADTLHAQQEALVAALARHGVAHENAVYPGMPHGFLQMEFLPPAREAIGRAVAFLDKHVRGA